MHGAMKYHLNGRDQMQPAGCSGYSDKVLRVQSSLADMHSSSRVAGNGACKFIQWLCNAEETYCAGGQGNGG